LPCDKDANKVAKDKIRTQEAPFLFFLQPYTYVQSPRLNEAKKYVIIHRYGSFAVRTANTQDKPSNINKKNHTIPNTYDGGRNLTIVPAFLPILQNILVEYPIVVGNKKYITSSGVIIFMITR
tara:strand:+ start:1994 stop:2362 length:369 start_codon:yes stop_codon:yes gene_type:complete